MLAVVTIRMWKSQPAPWVSVFRDSIARGSVLTVPWAMWGDLNTTVVVRLTSYKEYRHVGNTICKTTYQRR